MSKASTKVMKSPGGDDGVLGLGAGESEQQDKGQGAEDFDDRRRESLMRDVAQVTVTQALRR